MKKRMMRLSALLVTVMMLFSIPVSYSAAPAQDMTLYEDELPVSQPLEGEEDEPTESESPEDLDDPEDQGPDSEVPADPDSSLPEEDEVVPDPEPEDDGLKPAEEEPEELPGMPDGFVLSEEQMQAKRDMQANGMVTSMEDQTEGEDYAKGIIIYLADSEEEARMIADAYGAELLLYRYGIAEAKIIDQETYSVAELVAMSSDISNNLPPVSPNHIRHLYGEPAVEYDAPKEPIYFPGTRDNTILFQQDPPAGPYTNDPTDQDYQWHHDAIGTYTAWDATRGNIKVAVLDTGLQADHPDFVAANVEAKQMAVERDEDENIIGGPVDASDRAGHGTHVSGIIAAAANELGGVGVAPGVKLVSYQVFQPNADDGCYASDVAAAIKAAADDVDVKLINMSLGGIQYNLIEQDAVNHAYGKGVTVFAAAGNENVATKSFPAAYKNVVAVGATEENGKKAGFSNFGSWVDLAAPGMRILSTVPTTLAEKDKNLKGVPGYDNYNGTSMACPVAVGAAALVLSKYPDTTPAQLEARLKATGTKSGSSGIGKIVNVAEALAYTPEKPVIASTVSGNSASITFTSNFANNVDVYYTTDGTTPSFAHGNVTNGQKYDNATPTPVVVSGNGKMTVKAIAVNLVGKVSKTASATVTLVDTTPSIVLKAHNTSLGLGKSIQFGVTVNPKVSTKGALTWEVIGSNTDIVTLSSSGKLTLPKTASVTPANNKVAVKVTWTKDGSTYTATSSDITLYGALTYKVAWQDTAQKAVTLLTRDPVSATPQTATLVPVASDRAKTTITSAPAFFNWKSSNIKVAKVDATGKVTAVGKGTATITATAADGSAKKVTSKVTVHVPASKITIFSNYKSQKDNTALDTRSYSVAYGKTIKLSAAYGTAYGTPSNKKVKWEFDTANSHSALTPYFGTLIKINEKTGSLSFSSKLKKEFSGDTLSRRITVKATAQDGSGVSSSVNIWTYHATTGFWLDLGEWVPANRVIKSIPSKGDSFGSYYYIYFTTNGMYDYSVKSSNYNVVEPEIGRLVEYEGGPQVGGVLYMTLIKNGSATITVTANDGTNKTMKFKIKVSGLKDVPSGQYTKGSASTASDYEELLPDLPGDVSIEVIPEGANTFDLELK